VKVLAHAHTTYSGDGELTPQELADVAARRGFQAVLLSDHFEDLTAQSFARLVGDCRAITSCLMVPGYERSWRGYHVLALGVDTWFDDPTPESWAANVRAAGGLTTMAHPGRYRHEIPNDILAICEAIEVWNSKAGYDGAVGPNPRAYKLLGGTRRPLCGQDLHGVRHASMVALDAQASSADRASILETIRQGRYRMTNGFYAFDGALSSAARAFLAVFHAGRTPAMNAAMRIVKKARRARRTGTSASVIRP
jgi:hypothetical protein